MQMADLPADTPLYDGPVTERQFDQLPEPIPYDPSRARALLDAAGWQDSNGDGVRDQVAKSFVSQRSLQRCNSSDSTSSWPSMFNPIFFGWESTWRFSPSNK